MNYRVDVFLINSLPYVSLKNLTNKLSNPENMMKKKFSLQILFIFQSLSTYLIRQAISNFHIHSLVLNHLLIVATLSGLHLLLLLSLFTVCLHAPSSTLEASDTKDHFNGRHNKECRPLCIITLLRLVVLEGQEWVLPPLHNSENNKEIDSNECSECTVEATACAQY